VWRLRRWGGPHGAMQWAHGGAYYLSFAVQGVLGPHRTPNCRARPARRGSAPRLGGLLLVGWDRCPAGSILSRGNAFRWYLVPNLAVPGTWEGLSSVSDWSPNPPTPLDPPSEGLVLQAVEKKVVTNTLEL